MFAPLGCSSVALAAHSLCDFAILERHCPLSVLTAAAALVINREPYCCHEAPSVMSGWDAIVIWWAEEHHRGMRLDTVIGLVIRLVRDHQQWFVAGHQYLLTGGRDSVGIHDTSGGKYSLNISVTHSCRKNVKQCGKTFFFPYTVALFYPRYLLSYLIWWLCESQHWLYLSV